MECSKSPSNTVSDRGRFLAVTVSHYVPSGFTAVLGLQVIVQLVTPRAREALNVPRETARRALLHQQGQFLAATHQHEAAARPHLVSALARSSEAHRGTVISTFQRANQAREDQR